MSEQNINYRAIYGEGYSKDSNKEELGKFTTLKDAQKSITDHPKYKKSFFTKKGDASSRNPNSKEYFWIFDNQGYQWSIRP